MVTDRGVHFPAANSNGGWVQGFKTDWISKAEPVRLRHSSNRRNKPDFSCICLGLFDCHLNTTWRQPNNPNSLSVSSLQQRPFFPQFVQKSPRPLHSPFTQKLSKAGLLVKEFHQMEVAFDFLSSWPPSCTQPNTQFCPVKDDVDIHHLFASQTLRNLAWYRSASM